MDGSLLRPAFGRACTHTQGLPLRSLRKAIRVQSGDSVGAQLPQASTSSSANSSASSTERRAAPGAPVSTAGGSPG